MYPSLGRRMRRAIVVVGVLTTVAGACSSSRDSATTPPFGSGTIDLPTISNAPATSTPAVEIDSVAMVGDSITVGSQPALEESLASLGLADVAIDAQNGRRMLVDGGTIGSGLIAVTELVGSGPPDLWVIALGTNDIGNYESEDYPAAIGELLSAVPSGVPVVWVDTYIASMPDSSARFNDALRQALGERGDSTVVDWASLASEDGVLTDGIHPSGFGVEQFAEKVTTAVQAWMG